MRQTYRLWHWRKGSSAVFTDWRHERAAFNGGEWLLELTPDELVAFIADHQDVRIQATPFDGGLPIIYITTQGWNQR